MKARYSARTTGSSTGMGWLARLGWPTRLVLAAGVLAALLVAAVPVAFFAGVVLMLLGHIVGGLALFGASVLAAVAGVTIAALSGVRHLRKLAMRHAYRIVRLDPSRYLYE
jgi:hypothetical protein